MCQQSDVDISFCDLYVFGTTLILEKHRSYLGEHKNNYAIAKTMEEIQKQ